MFKIDIGWHFFKIQLFSFGSVFLIVLNPPTGDGEFLFETLCQSLLREDHKWSSYHKSTYMSKHNFWYTYQKISHLMKVDWGSSGRHNQRKTMEFFPNLKSCKNDSVYWVSLCLHWIFMSHCFRWSRTKLSNYLALVSYRRVEWSDHRIDTNGSPTSHTAPVQSRTTWHIRLSLP